MAQRIIVFVLIGAQAYSPDEMAEWINSINEMRGPKRASAPQASVSTAVCGLHSVGWLVSLGSLCCCLQLLYQPAMLPVPELTKVVDICRLSLSPVLCKGKA